MPRGASKRAPQFFSPRHVPRCALQTRRPCMHLIFMQQIKEYFHIGRCSRVQQWAKAKARPPPEPSLSSLTARTSHCSPLVCTESGCSWQSFCDGGHSISRPHCCSPRPRPDLSQNKSCSQRVGWPALGGQSRCWRGATRARSFSMHLQVSC